MTGCHSELPADLRALVTAALERIAPMIERVRTEPATAAAAGTAAGTGAAAATAPTSPCATCPVCAVIAVLRGERPEMAVRIAEQAAGILAVLRAALDEGDPAPTPEPGPPPAPGRCAGTTPGGRAVQHIHVERAGAGRARAHR